MIKDRYSRQIRFSPIGTNGQQALSQSHVLIVGAGALGASSAEMLARGGVGKLSIIDRDYVDASNLQRQQLYTEHDVQHSMPKAVAAKKALQAINSSITIHNYVCDATMQELEPLLDDVDVILDATDNFETRFIINDLSQRHQIPWIYGACVGSYGITYTILPGKTPCLTCLMQQFSAQKTDTCDTVGIISPAVHLVTSYQVAETLKLLVGDFKALRKTLVSFDLWKNEFSAVQVDFLKNESCPSCGTHDFPYLQFSNQTKTEVLCGRDTVQIRPPKPIHRNLQSLGAFFQSIGQEVMINAHLVASTIDGHRFVAFADGRVLIHGTKDIAEAKSLYAKYFA